MPGAVIGKRLNYGYPGAISRSIDAVVTNRRSTGKIKFGAPVILNNDNTYSAFGESNVAADFVGIAVREVKQSTNYINGTSQYEDKERTDVLNRGSICITVNVGNPTPNGKVYIRVSQNDEKANGIVGGFEAEADGAHTIELSNVRFATGNLDSNKVAEVTILSRTM